MAITQCSDLTRNLYNFQRDFHKKHSEDATFSGLIMTHLVGRVITIGVTLLLHAEAVCRAVAACFNNIRKVFSMTNEELVQASNDLEYSKTAYSGSWKSFKAIFYPSLLSEEESFIPEEVREPVVLLGHPFEEEQQQQIFDFEEEFRLPAQERRQLGAAPPPQEEVGIVVVGGGENVVVEEPPLQMPQMAQPIPVPPQLPEIVQGVPLAALEFGGGEINLVGQDGEFQMPAFAQGAPVQPEMPGIRHVDPLAPLHFGDEELDAAPQAGPFQMPAMAEAVYVVPAMPEVRQANQIAALNFDEEELHVVPQDDAFQMPMMAEAQHVDPVMPEMRQESAIGALNFADAELEIVPDEDPFEMPAIAEAVYVAPAMPEVRQANQIAALNFDEGELHVVPHEEAFQMPELAEAQHVAPVMPEMRQAIQLASLQFENAELSVIEDEAPFQMPQLAAAVEIQPAMPAVQQGRAIHPLLFADHEVSLVPQGDEFHIPEMAPSIPVQPMQQMQRQGTQIGALQFDADELSVVDPSLLQLEPPPQMSQGAAVIVPLPAQVQPLRLSPIIKGEDDSELVVVPLELRVPTEAALEIISFPPVAGSQIPGVMVQEDYFAGPGNPQIERISKESEEILAHFNREEVLKILKEENGLASSHSSPTQAIPFRSAEAVQLNGDWEFSNGCVGGYRIGRCHYSDGQRGMEHLASVFTFKVKGKEHKVPLIGIFDPVGGPTAAKFLRVNLVKALSNHLAQFNDTGFSPHGIWAAISLTFIQLNQLFLHKFAEFADEGSSATVVMELDERLWVINIGKSRAALNNRGRAFQCTSYDEQGGFGFSGQKLCRPRISCFPMEQIGIGSHIIIGNDKLFETAGTATLADWINRNKDKPVALVTRDMVYSAFRAKKTPLACFVMSLNHDDWEFLE